VRGFGALGDVRDFDLLPLKSSQYVQRQVCGWLVCLKESSVTPGYHLANSWSDCLPGSVQYYGCVKPIPGLPACLVASSMFGVSVSVLDVVLSVAQFSTLNHVLLCLQLLQLFGLHRFEVCQPVLTHLDLLLCTYPIR
jgi:hypothetical protein